MVAPVRGAASGLAHRRASPARVWAGASSERANVRVAQPNETPPLWLEARAARRPARLLSPMHLQPKLAQKLRLLSQSALLAGQKSARHTGKLAGRRPRPSPATGDDNRQGGGLASPLGVYRAHRGLDRLWLSSGRYYFKHRRLAESAKVGTTLRINNPHCLVHPQRGRARIQLLPYR